MSKRYDYIKVHRKRVKKMLVDAFGGKCGICEYNKCIRALEFHHVNQEDKEFSISFGYKKWSELVVEARKCVCVCSNCHKEIHDGITKVTEDTQRFNEEYVDAISKIKKEYDKCPICGKKKEKRKNVCSLSCAGKKSWKVDWDSIDLNNMVKVEKRTFLSIGEEIGLTGNAVKKRYDRINRTE